jgi:hypothetical protein
VLKLIRLVWKRLLNRLRKILLAPTPLLPPSRTLDIDQNLNRSYSAIANWIGK